MPNQRKTRRRGQALLELALVIVFLLALTMGLVQFGIIYFAQASLMNVTRDAARFAAIHGREEQTVLQAKVRDYIKKKLGESGGFIPPSDIQSSDVTIARPEGSGTGQPITVDLTYDMTKKFFVPVPEWGLDKTKSTWKQFHTKVSMSIE